MLVNHLDSSRSVAADAPSTWHHVGDGRAAVLFVLVAGYSLALATGGTRPHAGSALADDRLGIFVRAAVLFVIGAVLAALDTPIAVILDGYAVYFVLSLPLLRLPPRVLALLGLTLAGVGPLIIGWAARTIPDFFGTPFGALLLGGHYPALQWTGFLLLGLALGRWGLAATAQVVLGLAGLGLGVVLLQIADSARSASIDGRFGVGTVMAEALRSDDRSVNPLVALAALSVACAVLAWCLLIAPGLGVVGRPVEAVGRVALSLYVAHVVGYAIAVKVDPALWDGSMSAALLTIVAALGAATIWLRFFRQGPLEWLLGRLVTGTRTGPEREPS